MICGTLALAAGGVSHALGEAYGALDGLILRGTIRFSAFAASLPCATMETGRIRASGGVAWYAAIGLIAFARERRKRAMLTALLLAALNAAVLQSPDPAFARERGLLRLSMIDVGQGDAFLVEFPGGTTLLVDTGPRMLHADAGKKVVAPFLRRRGIRTIDLLVLSHPDADHAGGAPALLERFRIGRRRRLVRQHTRRHVRVDSARGGMLLPVPACAQALLSLAPARAHRARCPCRAGGRSNNDSIVLKLVFGDVSFLFTGDAERESEAGMIRAWGGFLRSTVLKVAHHGSDSGTSAEFLDAVRPSVAPRFRRTRTTVRTSFGRPPPPARRERGARPAQRQGRERSYSRPTGKACGRSPGGTRFLDSGIRSVYHTSPSRVPPGTPRRKRRTHVRKTNRKRNSPVRGTPRGRGRSPLIPGS